MGAAESPQNQHWETLLEGWRKDTPPEAIPAHAARLGVAPEALVRLGAAWAAPYAAWAFPMRDGNAVAIGIRLRSPTGRKWAVKGSRAGLIYEPALIGSGPLLICEGPTDTAAALTLGFPAIGRPSCRGSVDLVRERLRGWTGDVIIVADLDEPKADGFRPGLEGARDLAQRLNRPLRMILPTPHKDLREWVRAGATRPNVLQAISDAMWLNVR